MFKYSRLLLFLALAAPLYAQEPAAHQHWPARLLSKAGHQLKQTFYTDPKQHPFVALAMGVQFGLTFTDLAGSCVSSRNGYSEVGPSRFFVGSHPNCKKFFTFGAIGFTLLQVSENYAAHGFQDLCTRDANNPNSKWYKVDAHTYKPKGCFSSFYAGVTLGYAGMELPYDIKAVRAAEGQ